MKMIQFLTTEKVTIIFNAVLKIFIFHPCAFYNAFPRSSLSARLASHSRIANKTLNSLCGSKWQTPRNR